MRQEEHEGHEDEGAKLVANGEKAGSLQVWIRTLNLNRMPRPGTRVVTGMVRMSMTMITRR